MLPLPVSGKRRAEGLQQQAERGSLAPGCDLVGAQSSSSAAARLKSRFITQWLLQDLSSLGGAAQKSLSRTLHQLNSQLHHLRDEGRRCSSAKHRHREQNNLSVNPEGQQVRADLCPAPSTTAQTSPRPLLPSFLPQPNEPSQPTGKDAQDRSPGGISLGTALRSAANGAKSISKKQPAAPGLPVLLH